MKDFATSKDVVKDFEKVAIKRNPHGILPGGANNSYMITLACEQVILHKTSPFALQKM